MKLATLLVALSALLAGVVAAPASAAPHAGGLDRAFSGDGIALRGFGQEPVPGGAEKAAQQPDGRVLVFLAGWRAGISIGRFWPDGNLDPSFGDGGYLTADLGAAGSVGTDFAVQPDGRIVVAGFARRRSSESGTLFAVARFLPDGAPDPSFGGDGSVVFPGKPRFLRGYPGSVLIQPDGRILLIGQPGSEGRAELEVVRLEPDGSFDRSYGGDGFVSVFLSKTAYLFANDGGGAIAFRDGKLTVALESESGGSDRAYRFNSDGSLDLSFGGDGRVDQELLVGRKSDLAVDAAGRTVATAEYGRVIRLLPDGSLDPSFGDAGIVRLGDGFEARAVSALADGRLALAGVANEHPEPGPREAFVARLDEAGRPDPGFGGGDGVASTDLVAGSEDEATAMLMGADGGVLIAGSSTPTEGDGWSSRRIMLARYGPAGDLDLGFGSGGVAIAQARMLAADAVFGVAAGPRGTTVATGRAGGGIAVVRYRRDGEPDPRFGDRGAVRLAVTGSARGEQGESLAVLPGGGLVVGTTSADGGALLRLRPGGALDPGFGRGGVVRTEGIRAVVDLLRLADGKILAVGIEGSERGVLLRYLPGGSLDRDFGDGGRVRFGEVDGKFGGRVDASLAVDRRGRILIAAPDFNGGRVQQFSPNGEPVKSFGRHRDGRRDQGHLGRVIAVAVGRDGKIAV
ncbi:MAG TPA: hypothetical protein VFB52_04585, partial [Solirubrobacterales bacterium]|nr:hypothetical protein [Solirubrobacterales bacterium]